MLCSPLICRGSVFFSVRLCQHCSWGDGGALMLIAARWGKQSASIYSRNMLRQPTPHEHSYNYFQSDPLKWKVCFANRRQKRRHNQKPTCERLAILVSPSPSPLQFQTSSLSLPPGARRHVSSSPRPCVPNNCATCTGQCVEILQFLI